LDDDWTLIGATGRHLPPLGSGQLLWGIYRNVFDISLLNTDSAVFWPNFLLWRGIGGVLPAVCTIAGKNNDKAYQGEYYQNTPIDKSNRK